MRDGVLYGDAFYVRILDGMLLLITYAAISDRLLLSTMTGFRENLKDLYPRKTAERISGESTLYGANNASKARDVVIRNREKDSLRRKCMIRIKHRYEM